jgi:hypothetical protein
MEYNVCPKFDTDHDPCCLEVQSSQSKKHFLVAQFQCVTVRVTLIARGVCGSTRATSLEADQGTPSRIQ